MGEMQYDTCSGLSFIPEGLRKGKLVRPRGEYVNVAGRGSGTLFLHPSVVLAGKRVKCGCWGVGEEHLRTVGAKL